MPVFLLENVVCLLHLLHIFKCTPDYFYQGSHHYEVMNPDQTAREQSDLGVNWLHYRLHKYI